MNGETTLFTTLLNNSSVTDLLTLVPEDLDTGRPEQLALAVAIQEPVWWLPEYTTISIYRAVPVDNSEHYLDTELTCNCRAGIEESAKELASAVVDAVNIVSFDSGRFYCSTGGVIPPEDETDSYNIPITVTVKAVKEQI